MIECSADKPGGVFMRFTVRDLLWLMVALGMGLGWYDCHRTHAKKLGLAQALSFSRDGYLEHDVRTEQVGTNRRVRVIHGERRGDDGKLLDVNPLATHTYTLNYLGDLVSEEWLGTSIPTRGSRGTSPSPRLR
jgi:hypothetical protein